jgi:hypothetical protein
MIFQFTFYSYAKFIDNLKTILQNKAYLNKNSPVLFLIQGLFFWSERRDSNSRPRPWQGRALPTELLSLTILILLYLPIAIGMSYFRLLF